MLRISWLSTLVAYFLITSKNVVFVIFARNTFLSHPPPTQLRMRKSKYSNCSITPLMRLREPMFHWKLVNSFQFRPNNDDSRICESLPANFLVKKMLNNFSILKLFFLIYGRRKNEKSVSGRLCYNYNLIGFRFISLEGNGYRKTPSM